MTNALLMPTPNPDPRLIRMGWGRASWKPHKLQEEILLSTARMRVLAGGRRIGKSQVGGYRILPEVFRAYYQLNELRRMGLRREGWIIGPEYSDAEKEFRVIWNALQRFGFDFDHPGSYNNAQSGEMRISLFNGTFIIDTQSAKYPANLVGEGLTFAVFSEAAKLKPSTWIKYVRPTLADFGGWAQFGSTPEGKNWFYDLFMAGLDPDNPAWKSWRAPSWENPYVYPGGADRAILKLAAEARRQGNLDLLLSNMEMLTSSMGAPYPRGVHEEIWQMFLDMSQELFNQEIGADFTEFVGRVFKDFDEELHVTSQEFQPGWDTYACADYGFTNPFVWLLVQVDPFGERVHVLDEYYDTGKTTEEAAAAIKSRGLAPSTVRKFYPDPAEPDRTKTLEQALQIKAHKGGSIPRADRIEWGRRKLKFWLPDGSVNRGGHPGLTFHRRCVNTIREHNDYRYPETAEQASERGRNAPEEPMDKDNHTPEALGRLFSGLFGSPHKKRGGIRQGSVRTRRG